MSVCVWFSVCLCFCLSVIDIDIVPVCLILQPTLRDARAVVENTLAFVFVFVFFPFFSLCVSVYLSLSVWCQYFQPNELFLLLWRTLWSLYLSLSFSLVCVRVFVFVCLMSIVPTWRAALPVVEITLVFVFVFFLCVCLCVCLCLFDANISNLTSCSCCCGERSCGNQAALPSKKRHFSEIMFSKNNGEMCKS